MLSEDYQGQCFEYYQLSLQLLKFFSEQTLLQFIECGYRHYIFRKDIQFYQRVPFIHSIYRVMKVLGIKSPNSTSYILAFRTSWAVWGPRIVHFVMHFLFFWETEHKIRNCCILSWYLPILNHIVQYKISYDIKVFPVTMLFPCIWSHQIEGYMFSGTLSSWLEYIPSEVKAEVELEHQVTS